MSYQTFIPPLLALLPAVLLGVVVRLAAGRFMNPIGAGRVGFLTGCAAYFSSCLLLVPLVHSLGVKSGEGLTPERARAEGLDLALPLGATAVDFYREFDAVVEVDFTAEEEAVTSWAQANGWPLRQALEDVPFIEPVKEHRLVGIAQSHMTPRDCLIYSSRPHFDSDLGRLVAFDRASGRAYYRWRK